MKGQDILPVCSAEEEDKAAGWRGMIAGG